MIIIKPSDKAIKEAVKNPYGWVYILVKAFEGDSEVPKEAIKGAWRVNAKGIIIGEFIPNPNFKSNKI